MRSAAEKPLAPGLYLVATPIGNLEDITLRALRILSSVDRIACEDTRQTQKLLHHYNIATPTISYHQHNEVGRAEELITAIRRPDGSLSGSIAVVSDAGTPGIADPGAQIAAAAIAAGIPVYPIPGANAALSALIASGLQSESFVFHGFLPAKEGQRRTALEALPPGTHIFYETPHRIVGALNDIVVMLSEQQPVVLARELTKIHEEFHRGTAASLLADFKSRPSIRGEIVLLLPITSAQEKSTQQSIAAVVAALMKSENLSEMDALKRVAKSRNISKSEAYRELQRSR
jgi:16S rRNA (cytidine1402-2'-O)-methyltransferase